MFDRPGSGVVDRRPPPPPTSTFVRCPAPSSIAAPAMIGTPSRRGSRRASGERPVLPVSRDAWCSPVAKTGLVGLRTSTLAGMEAG